MGWTYTYRRSDQSVRDVLEYNFGITFVDFSIVRLKTAYAAYPTGRDGIAGMVVLLDYHVRGQLGYKDIPETSGPVDRECPERILRQLTPLKLCPNDTSQRWALNWRLECWKNVHAKKAKPKLTSGDIVRFSRPIRFSNNQESDVFHFEKVGKRSPVWYMVGKPGRYRIPNWKQYTYAILTADEKQVLVNR